MNPRNPIYWLNLALLFIAIGLISFFGIPSGEGRSLLLFASLAMAAIGLIVFRKKITSKSSPASVSTYPLEIHEKIEQLSAERDRLRGILQGMLEGVAVTDSQGTITLANPAFYEMFHLDSRCEGKTLLESLLNKELQEHLESCLKSQNASEAEVTFRLGTEEKICLVHLTPLSDETEKETGAVLVFFDLTTIRRLERARQDFVANVSHELKTPLTSIRGYVETLLNGQPENPEVSRRFMEKIEKNAGLLQELIEDLLRISEIESGRKEWNPKPVFLPEVLHEVERLFSEALEIKNIQCNIQCPPGAAVMSEPAALKQILINLVDNGIKYNRSGGKLGITVERVGDNFQITVADTGMGIPVKDLPHIFERFYRVDKARTRDLGGSGLGLAIVKHLVQAQGGEVGVESDPGKGSRFILTLPACPP
jgi:two-component system phosphate regulon sensor histidine kinase PhoR